MSKFLAVTATLISLTAAGVAGFAYYQAWLNQPLDKAEETAFAEIGDVAGVAAADGDVVLDLTPRDDGGNTQLIWRCGKLLAGARSAGGQRKEAARLFWGQPGAGPESRRRRAQHGRVAQLPTR